MAKKQKSITNLVLIITTTVFSFSSMLTAFYMLGSQSLVWFIISALCYFVPYALIVAQYTKKYANRPGSIYDWLKDSLSPKAAFITVFLWYCSYFIWMISLFMKIMIPLSILLFGKDLTGEITWLGLTPQFWLALLSIGAVFLITWINNHGARAIFSILKYSSYAMIGLVVMSLSGNILLLIQDPQVMAVNFQHSLTVPSFFEGTSNRLLSQLPFFIFSITAFGGLDTIASLADKTENGRSRFPKAVIIGSFFILVLYFSGILLWSSANNITQLREIGSMHLGNLMYGLMYNLADTLGKSFGLSVSGIQLLQQIFTRYTAFTMAIAYLSLLCSISYGPLKSLIQGTPKEVWSKFSVLNKNGMPEKALWLQATAVSFVIAFLSLSNDLLANLFNQLTYMTNVSRAIPYFIVAASFPFFIRKGRLAEEALIVKSQRINTGLAISVCSCIAIAIAFQIYEPLKAGNWLNFCTLLLGPVAFGLIAYVIYQRLEKKFRID